MDVDLQPVIREQLPLVETWFEDPDTQLWLGGPGWLRAALDRTKASLGIFRGAQETGRYRFLAWEDDRPVGFIDCGTYDKWVTWEGGPGGRGVLEAIDVSSGAIAYVVDPAMRGRGYGVGMISSLMEVPELAPIELFAAGVEPDNVASVRCLVAAGFTPLDPEPDWEGIVYYTKRRP